MRSVNRLAITMTLVATLVMGAPSSSQGGVGCVNSKEFSRAKTGMTVAAVAKIFGTNGKEFSQTKGFGQTVVIRDYKACTEFGVVNILYTNGRLTSKTGIF